MNDLKKWKKYGAGVGQAVIVAVYPILAFYLMECYTHNPIAEVRPWAQLFNMILFELVAWILIFVTGRIRLALRVELTVAMLYGIANAYVVRFRTNPIVPWDIFSWKTAASVAENYDFKPDQRMILVTGAFFLLLFLAHFVKQKKLEI